MVNRLYNKQVSPKNFVHGGRVKKKKSKKFPDMSGDNKVTKGKKA